MARPNLGASARVVHGQVRLSRAEEEAFVLRYGSTGKGLRAAVDHLMAGLVAHRHTRHRLIATTYENGAKIEQWECTCGQKVNG